MPFSSRLVVAALAGLLLIPVDAAMSTAGPPSPAKPYWADQVSQVQPVLPDRAGTVAAVSSVTPEQIRSGPAIASSPVAVRASTGAMSAFATGTDSTVYTSWQTAPGGTFSSWTHL